MVPTVAENENLEGFANDASTHLTYWPPIPLLLSGFAFSNHHARPISFMHELKIEGVGTCEVEEGTRLVRAIAGCGVDVGHRCGGQAKCTTCRVEFGEGEPGVMTEAEYEKLTDIGQYEDMRLSCQIVVDRDMVVTPLMTVEDQGWDDAGPDPAVTVEPAAEWHPIGTLEE